MNLVELAQRIRNLRLDKRMTLEQVASRTGLTRSWLSKVENFRVTPSLSALGEIAAALNVSIAHLVEGLDEKPEMVLIRKEDRKPVERDKDRSRILYESLAYKRVDRAMDPFLLTIPAEDSSREPMSHEGEEFLMVISGNVDMRFGNETYQLNAGDCMYFDGRTRHCLINPYAGPAQVLCVFYARQLGGDATGDDRE
ncbi:MAG TPA: XRE family transcriptional regulator [Planctomicrobium sp.]|nr:XRE family transcriptional regulator [Planctomicrobium sp.]